MDGEELYELYAEAELHINNCEVDSWQELDESMCRVWHRIAEQIEGAE